VKNPNWITTPQTSSIVVTTENSVNGAYAIADQITTGMRFKNELTPGKVTITSVTKTNTGVA
jgi:hypothetical protein